MDVDGNVRPASPVPTQASRSCSNERTFDIDSPGTAGPLYAASMRRLCTWLLFALGLTATSSAYTPTEYANLTYSSVSGQTLDLFTPTPLGSPLSVTGPAIVFVHGGGWVSGAKEDMDGLAYAYASLGYITVSINYRLATVAPWPACIDDCQAAVRWVRKYASTIHADSKHIAAYGISAGGHLVNCMGTNDTLHDFDPSLSGYSSRPQAVIDYLGPSDFTKPSQWDPTVFGWIEQLIGHLWNGDPTDFKAASPAYMVNSKAAPAIIFGSRSDPIVPIAQSREMYQAYLNFSIPSEYHEFPGQGHGFSQSEYNQCIAYEQKFMNKWLRGR